MPLPLRLQHPDFARLVLEYLRVKRARERQVPLREPDLRCSFVCGVIDARDRFDATAVLDEREVPARNADGARKARLRRLTEIADATLHADKVALQIVEYARFLSASIDVALVGSRLAQLLLAALKLLVERRLTQLGVTRRFARRSQFAHSLALRERESEKTQ